MQGDSSWCTGREKELSAHTTLKTAARLEMIAPSCALVRLAALLAQRLGGSERRAMTTRTNNGCFQTPGRRTRMKENTVRIARYRAMEAKASSARPQNVSWAFGVASS